MAERSAAAAVVEEDGLGCCCLLLSVDVDIAIGDPHVEDELLLLMLAECCDPLYVWILRQSSE